RTSRPLPLTAMDDQASASSRRAEPAATRLDRNWNELLQEIRVLQTGSQILAAFLIVLPFQSRFEELDRFQTGWYLGLVALAMLIVALLLTPVAIHRHLFRRRVKDEMVRAANLLLRSALMLLGLLLTGVSVFIADFVVSRAVALGTGVVMAVLLIAVPLRMGRSAGRPAG